MKNYTALKRVSLPMDDTINLHEHVIQKDTLSMAIHLVKTVQEITCIYTKIHIFRLELSFKLNSIHEKNEPMKERNNIFSRHIFK